MVEINLLVRVKELLYYRDGSLFRRLSRGSTFHVGTEAGGIDNSSGYYRVKIDGKSYLNHRLIYLLCNGYLPDFVDHVDGNPLNNYPANLRATTKKQNRWNCKGNTGSISGIKGVYLDGKKWKVLVTVAGQRYYLGMHETREQAQIVASNKYKELQGNFYKHTTNNVCNTPKQLVTT